MFAAAKTVFFLAILNSSILLGGEFPGRLTSLAVPLPDSYGVHIDDGDRAEIQLRDLFGKRDFSEVVVQLTTAKNVAQEVRSDEKGIAVFENLAPGFVAFSVTDRDLNTFAAFGAFLVKGKPKKSFIVPVIMDSRDEVLKALRRDSDQATPGIFNYANFDHYQKLQVPFYRVRLRDDGRLTGSTVIPTVAENNRALAISREMNVTIIRDGRPVDRTISAENGSFQFTNLAPGIYGVIVSGHAGYAAFSFELLAANAPEFTPVSTRNYNLAAVADDLTVVIIPEAMLVSAAKPFERSVQDKNSIVDSGPAGSTLGSATGTSGVGGGGAAGGGAGGGLGGIGGLAAAAAAAAAAGGGGGGGGVNNVPAPASPVKP